MIRDAALAPILRITEEGEMILKGKLLKGVSDEQIAWQIIEKVNVNSDLRITLHAYWHDIFIVSKVVTIHQDDTITWGVTKI